MQEKPVVASFCADFLKADMQHIYRQISGLENWQPVVITRKRENEEAFPFPSDKIILLAKSPLRVFRRFWHRNVRKAQVPMASSEVATLEAGLEKHGAELLHIYFGNIAASLLPYLRRKKIPVIVSFHGADGAVGLDRPQEREAMIEVLQLADGILTRSQSLSDQLIELGADPQKMKVQHTSLPLEKWEFKERSFPENGMIQVSQVCRLIEKKGLMTSLKAFAALLVEYPRARFIVVGDGPLLDSLREMTKKYGIDDAVHFLGFLGEADVQKVIDSSHVFFHPSETGKDGNCEGIPNAMLEAMACGLPVCATNHAGIPEAIEDGVSGCLVEEGDSRTLYQKTSKLLSDEAFYQKVACNGREVIEKKFERKGRIAALEQVYTEVSAR